VAALDEFNKQKFDLVVTDYNMPRMNGLELLKIIRSMQEDLPVIMVTSHGDAALENEARRLQVYDYLTKSMHISVFRQTVEAALGK
jgi:DNA-binding NtrC family response regulator